MPEGSVNAYYYGQDYTELSKYLDFIVPMIYKGNYGKDTSWIGTTTKYIVNHSNGKPVIVGIQTYRSDSNLEKLSLSEINTDIKKAIQNGAAGYCLFRYGVMDKNFFQSTKSDGTSANGFTLAQISVASGKVKAFIEANKVLPNYVTIGSKQVSMPQFLYLISAGTVAANSGSTSLISLKTMGNPLSPAENMKVGKIYKSDYVDLASRIASFMDANKAAPSYGLVGLGEVRYENLVYLYSRVMNFYGTKKVMPNYASMKPWNTISTDNTTPNTPTDPTETDSTTKYTLAQISAASAKVKAFIEANKALPNYVTIGSKQVSMPQFLYLITSGTVTANSGSKTSITLKDMAKPINPSEKMNTGNINKSDYVNLASRIVSFMDANKSAPSYGLTGLGEIRYENLVYLYSRVMNFYGTQHVMANYASMKTWSSITNTNSGNTDTDTSTPTGMEKYLKPTANCPSTDPQIVSQSKSITSGTSTAYEKATRIFNWVRDNVEYSWYYDSQKGALGVLSSRSANCCDHSNLVVALSRAAGLPARYEHGVCTFTSGLVVGHVWAQIYVNGKWYNADAVSSRNDFGIIRNWNTNSWTFKGIYAELPF
jgi:hypothetical protein